MRLTMARVDLIMLGHPAEEHVRHAVAVIRFLSVPIKDSLRHQGLWEDLIQELYRIALETWHEGKAPKDVDHRLHRELRTFFRAYGYVRYQKGGVDGLVKCEATFTAVCTRHGEEQDPDHVLGHAQPPPVYDPPAGLEEAIVAYLRKRPAGATYGQIRRGLWPRHRLRVPLLMDCCERMVVRGILSEAPRARCGSTGRLPDPLLILDGCRQ